jgi:hypothetical protein
LNSGILSRKRTPLWAIETSPGVGLVPPPSKPAAPPDTLSAQA